MGKKQGPAGEYRRIIVLPDLHVPYHDRASVGAVLSFMADECWDEVVILGDFMDFDCISDFNAKNLRQVEGSRVQDDYDTGNELLDQIQKSAWNLNNKCKITLLEGNHDERMERYLNANPVLVGLMEPPKQLRLAERGIRWIRAWSRNETYKIGKATFHHGLYCNKYHAAKMVDVFGVPIFYGHTHDVQSYSKVFHGEDKTVIGQSLGCLCSYDQHYLKGAPTKWQQAFATFQVFPDGFFQYAVTPIFKHRFVGPTNGKIYLP